ncbi:MAG: Fis family transcriptional regulator, partial [Desulfobacterales bacterium]|nr:Fis family transcriptional regulator [Desulfobacterales bacterium]
MLVPAVSAGAGGQAALVDHFILKKAREMKLPKIPSVSRRVMDNLMAYHWPGNVRELENAV